MPKADPVELDFALFRRPERASKSEVSYLVGQNYQKRSSSSNLSRSAVQIALGRASAGSSRACLAVELNFSLFRRPKRASKSEVPYLVGQNCQKRPSSSNLSRSAVQIALGRASAGGFWWAFTAGGEGVLRSRACFAVELNFPYFVGQNGRRTQKCLI